MSPDPRRSYFNCQEAKWVNQFKYRSIIRSVTSENWRGNHWMCFKPKSGTSFCVDLCCALSSSFKCNFDWIESVSSFNVFRRSHDLVWVTLNPLIFPRELCYKMFYLCFYSVEIFFYCYFWNVPLLACPSPSVLSYTMVLSYCPNCLLYPWEINQEIFCI